MPNHESTQPPVYYAVAGGWYKLGKALGLSESFLLYWLRMMNVVVYMLMVWVSYMFVRKLYGGNQFLLFGVPLMLAFFPQDVFYTVNSDVLSPLLCGLALYCLFDTYLAESEKLTTYLITGLTVSAAFLTKFTNLPLVLISGVFMFLMTLRARRAGRLREALPKVVSLFCAAALPIGIWLIMNYLAMGDITGSVAKTQMLGWSVKPIGEIWNHPIFSPGGIVVFWDNLMKTFWRGEIAWHGTALASGGADLFYSISSFLLLLVSGIGLWTLQKRRSGQEQLVGWVNFGMLLLSVAMLAVLSTLYDFGDCFYPSQEYPYITSGRLISGMLIPFLVLYLNGLDLLLSKIGLSSKRWVILLVIVAVMLGSEVLLSRGVFSSAYNLFHML